MGLMDGYNNRLPGVSDLFGTGTESADQLG